MTTYKGWNLEKYSEEEKVMALIEHLDLERVFENDADEVLSKLDEEALPIVEDGPCLYHTDKDEYKVFTDIEAEEALDEHFNDSEFRYYWIEDVKQNRTDDSLADYTENAKSNANRGEVLATDNGQEEEEKINGTVYYIYRC